VKDIPGLHSFEKFFVTIFPIDWGAAEICRECFEEPVALTIVDWRPNTDFHGVRDRNHDSGFGGLQSEQIEAALHASNFAGGDLLDYAYAVIRVHDFLADFEAHRYLLVTNETE